MSIQPQHYHAPRGEDFPTRWPITSSHLMGLKGHLAAAPCPGEWPRKRALRKLENRCRHLQRRQNQQLHLKGFFFFPPIGTILKWADKPISIKVSGLQTRWPGDCVRSGKTTSRQMGSSFTRLAFAPETLNGGFLRLCGCQRWLVRWLFGHLCQHFGLEDGVFHEIWWGPTSRKGSHVEVISSLPVQHL